MKKIGFIVNPIAGMGGKVGLKGTDGVLKEAKKRGAKPIAHIRSKEMLGFFVENYSQNEEIKWITCSGKMGEVELRKTGIEPIDVVYEKKIKESSSDDTKKACKIFLEEKVDIIVFCGGDGTARDIVNIVDKKIPILGIPSGVKMHSGVFGINTNATAKMLNDFIEGNLAIGDAEIMDLDEDLYRKGKWKVKLFGTALGIVEPTYIQVGKASFQSVSDEEVKNEIADHIAEEIEKNEKVLFLFGSGGTIDHIAKKMGVENTILGIDAIFDKKNIGKDLNEKQILELLKKYKKYKLILSPIGAQGFILGRGNLQISPQVVKKIGFDNIIVVSTPSKLKSTPVLRVDTGDRKLDRKIQEEEFIMVVIGYRVSRVVKIQTSNL